MTSKSQPPIARRRWLRIVRNAIFSAQLASHLDGSVALQLIILAGLGLGSALLYRLGLTNVYPLMRGLHFPRGTWTTFIEPTMAGLARHIGTYLLVSLAYILALRQIETIPSQRRNTVIAITICSWMLAVLVLFGVYPGGESHDIFDYIFRGRMLAEYQASPLAVPPQAFAGAPYYAYISWHDHVDTYGPLWEYASGTIASIVGTGLHWFEQDPSRWPGCLESTEACGQLAAYLLAYRAFAVALSGVCGALIATMVRRHHPEHAPIALLAWLWNPLLLISTAVGAHNEIFAVLLIVIALSCIQQGHWLAGGFMLILAAHVKLTALLIAPVLLVWHIRRAGWRRAISLIGQIVPLSLILSWLLYLPLGGWETLPRMLDERSRYLANSLAALANRILREVAGWSPEQARQPTIIGATLVFGFCAVLILIHLWHTAGVRERHVGSPVADITANVEGVLWRALAKIMLVYLIIGSFWFQHWYIIWVLVPVALMPMCSLSRLLLPIYCCGALCGNAVGDFVYPHIILSPYLYSIITGLVVLSTLLPLILAALVQTWVIWRTTTIA